MLFNRDLGKNVKKKTAKINSIAKKEKLMLLFVQRRNYFFNTLAHNMQAK